LDGNVKLWLNAQTIPIAGQPSISANLHSKYEQCLLAPIYTAFSNTTSSAAWAAAYPKLPPVRALESPHNGMHLAVGGFDWPGAVFSPIRGANGDMGENNTAGLDPIFFFHHCFIDRVFWLWQQAHGQTENLSLIAIPGDTGTQTSNAAQQPTPGYEPGETLSLNSPLYPFTKPDGSWFTGNDLADIAKLGVKYGPGSLEDHAKPANVAAAFEKASSVPSQIIHVSGVDRTTIPGSFLITVHANINGKKELIDVEPVLSRWNVQGCANCQSHLKAEAYFSIPTRKHLALSKITSIIHPTDIQIEVNVITHLAAISLHHPLPGPFARLIKGQPFKVDIKSINY